MKKIDAIFSILIGLVVFVVFYLTMSPTISGHDSSELAAVQSTLGIAHPTGYPLFTIVGYLFSKIPISSSEVFNLNLLNALWGVFGIVVFYFILVLVLNNVFKKDVKENLSQTFYIRALSGFGCLLLAFSFTYWGQSLAVEVYTFHFLFLMLIIYTGLKSFLSTNNQVKSFTEIFKNWFLVSLFIGLGLTNHLSTLYIIPAIIYLFFSRGGFSKNNIGVFFLLFLMILFILAAVYSFIPIRSAQSPDLNWGAPSDFSSLWYHVTGGLYQEHFMTGLNDFKKQAAHYLGTLFDPNYWQFNIAVIFSLIGIEFLIRNNRKILGFLTIAFITNLIFALNYNIPDVDAYFMLSYIIIVISCCLAMFGIYRVIKNKTFRVILMFSIGGLMLATQLIQNYHKLDYSDNYLFLDYTKEVLNSVEPNAVIICNPMTPFVFPAWYLQNVENLRKDVAVISTTLNQRWYLLQVGKFHPDLVDLENNNFHLKFSERPTYIYSEMVRNFTLPNGFVAVPDQYLYKAVDYSEYYKTVPPEVDVRFTTNNYNPYLLYIKYNIAIMLENRLKYEEKFKKFESAKKYSDLLRRKFPDFPYESEYYYP